MLADSSQSAWAGRLDKEIHLPSTARIEIVYFIAQELPRWRDHPERKAVLGENKLTSQLCEHLSSAATYSPVWSHLQFRTEIADETNSGRSIDLAPKPRATTFIIEGRRQEVTGFVAVGPREFIALEPALGGRGDVDRGVGLEVVFDLSSDHLAGAGNRQRRGLDFFPAASGR